MLVYSLNGQWEMEKVGSDIRYLANVPTTMYQVLFENGVIEDPFYGENDVKYTELSEDNYSFIKTFVATHELMSCQVVELVFDGLDTLATITLNNKKIAKTNNMHRTYVFDVKNYLIEGENTLCISFDSPNKFIAKEQAKDPLWGIETTMDGYEHLRKAHHMFGWDWGPQMPDMGIWRDVTLKGYSEGKLDGFYITQHHSQNQVELEVKVAYQAFNEELRVKVAFIDHEGHSYEVEEANLLQSSDAVDAELRVMIDQPKLWWPNGFGEAYLYDMVITLFDGAKVIDEINKKIGLRTLTMHREPDQWGETFDIEVNGQRIFAMGADYIPEDAMITRPTEETTRRLIKDCATANYNCLRVWGGAYYPSDTFFNLCDEYGLVVWEDFMFACGVYRLTKTFKENITAEFIDNIKRIRHHACLGLWCGNNEMEWGFVEWAIPKDERLRMDYLLMYEKLIPDVLAEHDPNTFYWPASPSSGGGFDNPNGDNKGDVHYWNIYHGNEHYKKFREHYFRFASEYGMQSFPDYKTVCSYTPEEQMNVYSAVSENHNKCITDPNGNIKIMLNMAGEFQLPTKMEEIVYLSQVFQGETIKCAVEHFRRQRGRCMGSTYWQVNDNYPVASWASIDYYGRWKAMHYMAKRFYAPVLLSAYEEVKMNHIHMEKSKAFAHIHVTNEQLESFKGTVKYQVRHIDGVILEEKELLVEINPLSAIKVCCVDVMPFIKTYDDIRNIYVSYQLFDNTDVCVSTDSLLMTFHKHFRFKEANLQVNVLNEEDKTYIDVRSDEFVKSVAISFEETDVLLSDNYFDLLPGEERRISIDEWRSGEQVSVEMLKKQVKVMAVSTLAY